MDDELKDFEFLFKRLKLKQLYKIEEIVKKAISETEESLNLSDLDKASMRHSCLTQKSATC